MLKNSSPDQCGSVGWVSSRKAKGRWFNAQSGHVPGLQVWPPVRACMRGNQLMFLSLSFSRPSPLSKTKSNIKKKKKKPRKGRLTSSKKDLIKTQRAEINAMENRDIIKSIK